MNEVEIVVTGQDKTKPMFDSVKSNVSGLNKTFDDLRSNVRNTFSRMHDDINTKLTVSVRTVRSRGAGIGGQLIGGMTEAVKRGAGAMQDAFSTALGGVKGFISSPMIGPAIVAVLVGAAVAAAPVIATAIGGALITGLGAGMVGLGAMVLLQNEKIKERVSKSWAPIKDTLTRAFEPLIPVLEFAGKTMSGLAKEFEPVIKSAMQMAQGPLKGFVTDLATAFRELQPAIRPIMDAFSQVLGRLGPMLPGLFKSIANSLVQLSKTIAENSDLFAGLIGVILMAVPPIIDAIGWMIRTWRSFSLTSLEVFSTVGSHALKMADAVLGALESMVTALAKVPGPWQDAMQSAVGAIRGARSQVQKWKDDVERMPMELKLSADISELQSRLTTARRELKDPNLTKERRAKLNADIAALKSRLAEAQRRIDGLRGKTVTINENWYRNYYESRQRLFNNRASGGIVAADSGVTGRFRNGGQSGVAGTLALVGEQGPEVVRLPFGSSVIPSGQTRAMAERGELGGGGGSRVILEVHTGGSQFDAMFAEMIRKYVRVRGGNVQAVFGS